ncbi:MULTISPECIES: tyrosine recombinase XerC [unclassified Pseudofrankia]|uniref:site-specific integrase n=1 Tax=unclassified Pseudofrankia TaxID=2994372 RepID=UPI0008DA999B|nr:MULTISPECIES: site-specific integrase [unclassified Pseudofrankia]MDT3443614.1 site-specific integrase [Pseudofrankia sp. BMG5.37]OHV43929.1 integrase [Pseudofrankia sp. BMG5.36]
MQIKTEKRCGCRDPETGKQLGRRCPRLKGKKPHGMWSWRIDVPDELVPLVGRTGLRGSGFATKEAAEKDAEEQLSNVRAGQRHAGTLTVGQYLDEWLESKRRLRPSARRAYEVHIRVHLKPWLGKVPLAGLRADHIDRAFRQLEAAGAVKARPTGPATVERIRDTLRNALNDAVDRRMIQFNPVRGVELPEYSRPEVEPWEAHEVGAFLDEAATDRLAAMWELIALHGVRRGEACGATWPGLDADTSVLTISQQITQNGGKCGVWAPKTRSGKRKVDLDPITLGSLLAHRLAQDTERKATGPEWDNGTLPDQHGKPVHLSGLMFTRPDGRHLAPGYVSQRMQTIAKRAGLLATVRLAAPVESLAIVVGALPHDRDPIGEWTLYVDRAPVGTVRVTAATRLFGNRHRFDLAEPLAADVTPGTELGRGLLSRRRLHDLRHASASIQLAEGIDLALVSKRLGHSSPAITGALYAHLLRPAGQRAAAAVAAAVPRAVRPPTTYRPQ